MNNMTDPNATVSSTILITATGNASSTLGFTSTHTINYTSTSIPKTTTYITTTHYENITTTTTTNSTTGYIPTTSTIPDNSTESSCLRILYEDIGQSRVRIWDVTLFVPNLIFLLFLIFRFYNARGRLMRSLGGTSPIFTTYFILVLMTAVLSVIRCIVSMSVDVVGSVAASDANKLLWVILRFFLLMAEMSVLIFGLACGHLDSKSSIKRVLFITTSLALVYSITQGVLEMIQPDPKYEVVEETWTVYGHGGTPFSFITSVIFLIVYVVVVLLPFCDCVRKFLTVPTKKSFYIYACFMAVLYFCCAVGSGLLFGGNYAGLCIQDAASLAYFILFAPFLYWTFLHSYFGSLQPSSVLFSYSAQVDEGLDDMSDMAAHSSRGTPGFNGVLVFDRINSSSYASGKGGMDEPLRDLGTDQQVESPQMDGATINFFKDIDLVDADEDLNFR